VHLSSNFNPVAAAQVPAQVAFEADAARAAWRAVVATGLHPHAWVRAAAARLLGAAFAHPRVGEGLRFRLHGLNAAGMLWVPASLALVLIAAAVLVADVCRVQCLLAKRSVAT
jgi:hypothetical protein